MSVQINIKTALLFVSKESRSIMVDRRFSSPKRSLAALLKITCCCDECFGISTRSSGAIAARTAPLQCSNDGRLCMSRSPWHRGRLRARLRCRCPRLREIRFCDVKSSSDVSSRDLLLYEFPSFPAEHLKKRERFFRTQN